MLYRVFSLCWVALALALFVSRPASAADMTHEGKIVKAGDGKLTMTIKGHEQQQTHAVPKDAKITLDGKAAALEDLKEGFHVKVTMNNQHAVTKIEAHSKHSEHHKH